MLKNESLKDFNGKVVHVNDKVTLLVRIYGYRGLDSAFLSRAVYLGKGPFGYEFDAINVYGNSFVVRQKHPQCIFYRKGGK